MYYFLEKQHLEGEFLVKESSCDLSIFNLLSSGVSVTGKVDNLSFIIDPRKGANSWADYLSGNVNIPIISKKFKDIILDLEESMNIEFYPVKILNIKKEEVLLPKYFLMALIENISCLDEEKSSFVYFEGSTVVDSIDKLALNLDKIGGRNVFRIEEIDSEILISEKLKFAIEKNGLSGIKLLPVNEFTMH